MSLTVIQALERLDPERDGHWTSDGLPREDVMRQLTGNPELTRQNITYANPKFCRGKAKVRNSNDNTKQDTPTPEQPTVNPEQTQGTTPEQGEKQEVTADPGQIDPDAGNSTTQEEPPVLEKNLVQDEQMTEKEHLDIMINELSQEKSAVESELKKMHARRDALQNQENAKNSIQSNTEANLEYLESQKKLREARHADHRKLREILGNDVDPRCPLDRALNQKTRPGQQRRVIPLKGNGSGDSEHNTDN